MGSFIFDTILNLIFLVDIIINFISAHYDSDFNIVDDYKVSFYYNYCDY
jgi:hypothetical protein